MIFLVIQGILGATQLGTCTPECALIFVATLAGGLTFVYRLNGELIGGCESEPVRGWCKEASEVGWRGRRFAIHSI